MGFFRLQTMENSYLFSLYHNIQSNYSLFSRVKSLLRWTIRGTARDLRWVPGAKNNFAGICRQKRRLWFQISVVIYATVLWGTNQNARCITRQVRARLGLLLFVRIIFLSCNFMEGDGFFYLRKFQVLSHN